MYWILVDGDPVECSKDEYAAWHSVKENRLVASDEGAIWWVSTMFFGVSLGKDEQGRHLLFETAAKYGHMETKKSYATLEQAKKGHGVIVRLLRAAADSAGPVGQYN